MDENSSSYGSYINMWNFYNLQIVANKNIYIDSLLDYSLNAMDVNEVFHGKDRYRWVIYY